MLDQVPGIWNGVWHFGQDFLKLEVNKDVLGSNADPRKDKTTTAERRAVSFWLGRKKIFGLAYHERPTFVAKLQFRVWS